MLQSVVEVVEGLLAIPGESSDQLYLSPFSLLFLLRFLFTSASSVLAIPTLDLSTCKTKSEVLPLENERSVSTFQWFPSRKILA